jgi:autotransporter-associated beta strand protein
LILFGTAFLHAENVEPKDPAAHTVIVPYDIGKPLDLKQSNRFYLDYAEFQHLWDLAKVNRRPAKPIVEAGPQEAIINSALYDAEILADRFIMNARLSVVTRGGSWVKLPLGFKADGLFIIEVKVDGKSAVLEKEEVLIEQPGLHMVEVSLQVLKKAGWQDLRMELPKSPANLIALTISEQEGRPSFNNFDFMVTEDKRDGRRVFLLPMIMNSPLEFKREPLRQFVAEAAPTSSENKVSLNVLPRLEKVSAEIAFAFAGKERSSFSVRFDGSLKPTLWQVSYLKQWMLRKDGRDWVADITLTRPVADKFQVRLDAERIFAESTGSREAPRVVGDAVKTTTLFSIEHAEDLTVKTRAASSIQRTDVANNKSGAKSSRETYRWLNSEPLSYLVANAEDRSASQIEAVYQLSAQKAEIIAAITLDTGRGPLTEARVKLPQGFEVQSLAGPRVLSWHREGDEVLMLFDSQAVSNARLVVHVAKTLTQTTNTWKLESLLTPQFAKHKGTALIATHAADEVTLSFDASDRKLREVDPSTLNAVVTVAAPLVVKRALLTEKSNWSAQVGLNRQSPKFSVDAVLLAQATDEGLKLSQQIGLNIEQGAVGGVKLRLPKELPEARVRGALVRDAQSKLIGEVREYEVKFQEDVLERADFTLDLELPLEGEKILPVVQVDGASRAQRFLIVDNTSSKEMKTDTGGAESIIKDSLPYLPDGLQRPEYYRAGDTAKIKLGFNQLETTAGNAAIITLAEITSALRENGERWETVVYSIANRALQFLPVRLPANAELVEVSVGGQTVRADVDGSKKASGQVYLVPLIQMRAGELSQQVRLVYRLPTSEKSVVTKHTLDDPELVGLSAERTLWNVWLPEPFELKKRDGNMEDVGEEGREVEKQQSLLSDLNRLNQVLSSKDLKAEDANVAWANANKVVAELKHQQTQKIGRQSQVNTFGAGNSMKNGANKELPQQAIQSIAIANAEVDKQLDVQGSLLISNSSNVLRAQSQVEQGRNSFAGIVQGNINSNSGATQNWAFNGGNLTVQPKSEAKPADMNQLAVNDNVNIGQGFLDDQGAASKKSEPQGATLTKSGAGTLTLGSGVATFSGGTTLSTPTQNASQSGLQNNAFNNIASNARASKNAITANSGTSLDLNGINTYTGGTTINAGTTINGGTLNINGNVAGTGGVILAGNGKLELGDNDGASKEFQNALRIDKYNKAARRGMETAEQAKSQYYKTARDQTRASTLTGVSEGGESKVPAAPAKPSVVNAIGNSSASAVADPFAGPATSNATMNFTIVGGVSSTSTRAAVAAPSAGAVETESRNKALPATPQLKPVGRVSLAVEVPLEGTVHHFRKLKDHALIELTVIKPMESRQTSALWMLVIGGAILGGIEWARRWRAVK